MNEAINEQKATSTYSMPDEQACEGEATLGPGIMFGNISSESASQL
jgi:hypothetical protein